MRFARVVSPSDQRHPRVDRLVEASELDVLQLDYIWPHSFPVPEMYAAGFLLQLRTLHKTMYLNPNLHLITDAGGGNPWRCAEAVAGFLCEHGDAELPITAIRGSNLLSNLEELIAHGCEFNDISTGVPIDELAPSLIAAQVELGAGPFVKALEEGSQIVIAGCYDIAAPGIAAAVSIRDWSWEHTDRLAQLAVVSHLPETVIEIDQQNGLAIQVPGRENLESRQLRQQLLESADNEHFLHADVDCQFEDFALQESEFDAFRVTGVIGQESQGQWLLRLTYQAGYVAEAMLQCRGDQVTTEIAVEKLHELLDVQSNERRAVVINHWLSSGEHAPALLRVRCRSLQREPCVEFVDEINRFVLQSMLIGCELTGLRPSWQPEISQKFCHVPRDSVAISVDTRPAKEWR